MSPTVRVSTAAENSSKVSWEPKKIYRVVRDVKDSKKTSLLSFLVALLARLSLTRPSQESIKIDDDDVKSSRKTLDTMIRDAAMFCNNNEKQNARKFKAHLFD